MIEIKTIGNTLGNGSSNTDYGQYEMVRLFNSSLSIINNTILQ